MALKSQRYTTRRATQADIPASMAVYESEAHKSRLQTGERSYHPANTVMVVEEDNKIIGTVFIVYVRPLAWPDAEDTSRLPYLISVVVREDLRNQGAGTHLLQAAEDEIKSRGHSSVYLTVEPDDSGAKRLYLRARVSVHVSHPRVYPRLLRDQAQ